MTEPITLCSKEGLEFIKIKNNNYKLVFSIENHNIILPKIIDFGLLKLIYELNVDIYEKSNITIINENQANLTLLMKNLFEDIGLPQRFIHINIEKNINENKISFISHSIASEKVKDMPIDSKLLPIKNMVYDCLIINPHKVDFICNILFEDEMVVPQFVEKMVGLILVKIFKRIKQFIENFRI